MLAVLFLKQHDSGWCIINALANSLVLWKALRKDLGREVGYVLHMFY